MDKESSIKMARVLHDAQAALLSMAGERDKLAAKCEAFERRAEATKVAAVLHDKNIHRDMEFPELVEHLEKEAEAGRLETIARAADMVGPNMGFGSPNNDEVAGSGSDAFTSYLVGSVG